MRMGEKWPKMAIFVEKISEKKIQLPQFLVESPQNFINSSTVVVNELMKFWGHLSANSGR